MPRAALRSSSSGAGGDLRLARAAATGNGRAFATLLDRYEQRVFNQALRVTGSWRLAADATRAAFLDALQAPPHLPDGDRAFSSCLFTACRNHSYDLMEKAGTSAPEGAETPSAAPEEDEATDGASQEEQEEVREAALRLSPPERELLVLGELHELSYGEIAAIIDTEPAAVPELMARARLALHDEIYGTGVASKAARSADCGAALPLMAMRDDGQLGDEDDFAWLLDHLAHCSRCRLRLDATQSASGAYRMWHAAAPPPALFRETMSAAADLTGHDWSELIDARESRRATRATPAALHLNEGRAGLGRAAAAAGGTTSGALESLRAAASGAIESLGATASRTVGSLGTTATGLAGDALRHRPRHGRLMTAGLAFLVVLGLSAIAAGATLVVRSADSSEQAAPSSSEADAFGQDEPTPVQTPVRRPRAVQPAKPKEPAPAPRQPAVIRLQPDAAETDPAPEERPRRPVTRRRVPQAEAVPVPKPRQPSPPPTTTNPVETAPPASRPPLAVCRDANGGAIPCPG